MFHKTFLPGALILLITTLGCGGGAPTALPDGTLVPLATAVTAVPIPSLTLAPPEQPSQPAVVTEIPTLIPAPTQAPTEIPTLIRQPTRAITVSPTKPARPFAHVKIFLIAMNDNGASGPSVGCGDSVVGVEREIAPTAAPLTAALKELVSLHDQFYGQSGLYNALYQSDLHVERVAIINGVATIQLGGKLMLGGECDDPRVAAQIQSTARQFATVRSVVVLLNGAPLEKSLGGK